MWNDFSNRCSPVSKLLNTVHLFQVLLDIRRTASFHWVNICMTMSRSDILQKANVELHMYKHVQWYIGNEWQNSWLCCQMLASIVIFALSHAKVVSLLSFLELNFVYDAWHDQPSPVYKHKHKLWQKKD